MAKGNSDKQYQTRHSYFIKNAPSEEILMDEDMAKNVSNREKQNAKKEPL